MRTQNRQKIVKMTELAILTAIVFVLQALGIGLKLPFLATPVSLVLIPIVLGATVIGPKSGAWLGFVFGLEVFIMCGVMALDPFTFILTNEHPFITFMLCITKSTLAGFLSGIAYKMLKNVNAWVAIFVAAIVAPIVNTGVFILGCLLMYNTLESNFVAEGSTVFYFLIIGCAGLNFIIELLINIVFTPALNKLTSVLNKHLS